MHKFPLLIASVLLMGNTLQLHADEVKLTTALPVGENLQLALNADLQVELIWGNGEKQQLTGDGSLQSIPVKNADLTITSTSGKIVSLYVQGDKLTKLDVTAAPNVKYLLAADNQLSNIDVSALKKLNTLDVQGNQLAALKLTNCTYLKTLNAADNQLTSNTLTIPTTARLESVNVANNQLTSSVNATSLLTSRHYWAQNNQIAGSISLNGNNTHSVVLSNNKITAFTLSAKKPLLKDIWVDNNALTKLTIAALAPELEMLAADHNKITSIFWNNVNLYTLKYAYLNDNFLFPNSLPSLQHITDCVYAPQGEYTVKTHFDVNEQLSFSDLLSEDGFGNSVSPRYTLVDDKGNKLVRNTDYKQNKTTITFLKDHENVHFEITSGNFPDCTFKTTTFTIGDPSTGIGEVEVADKGLNITTAKGKIVVKAQKSASLHIVNSKGITIAHEQVEGTRTYNAPAGFYLVNGKKVIVL